MTEKVDVFKSAPTLQESYENNPQDKFRAVEQNGRPSPTPDQYPRQHSTIIIYQDIFITLFGFPAFSILLQILDGKFHF